MVTALKPIHEAAGIKRVVVATYQSTSGAGKEAMDELLNQTKSFFVNQTIEARKFTKNIAFNVIPHIDVFMEDGSTKEEWKMVVETKKILDARIKIHATCVRVPTFIGHAEAINLELERPLDDDEARRVLATAPGVLVVDRREPGGYITPQEVTGQDSVFVSRVRVDPTVENGLSLWVVSDNLRKGAALNAVQIAEELIKSYI
jgi:aspartate-semialdehyde dehydrogenase